MKAAILQRPGALDIVDLEVDKPGPHEVLVRTVGSGLCHSDLHLIDHDPTMATYSAGGATLLGHEASGVIEAVGSDVSYVRPGDHVLTFPVQFCGGCEYCMRGRPVLCQDSPGGRPEGARARLSHRGAPVTQFVNLGGFAEQMLVHENAVAKIDPDYPLDRAAVIGCGVCTGLGSVLNSAEVRPGASVAVLGCGGVGLSALQGARIAGALRIIAIDVQPEKFALARQCGATDCIDAKEGDAAEQVIELTRGGVDYSFECLGLKETADQCVRMLRPAGLATMVGVIPEVTIDGMWLLSGERRVQGAIMGSNRFRTDLPRYIELDRQGRLDVASIIEGHIALEEINDGYEAMRQRAIQGRRVIMFPQ